MATYVKGDAVANATSYELLEKNGETYDSLATAANINFEVSAMNFGEGEHILAVKAHADGYESSDPSNEVVYIVDAKDAVWEAFGQGDVATVSVEEGVPTITCTNNKAIVAMLKTSKNFSFTAPRDSAADGGRMVIIGKYGTNAVAFRPRGGTTGTMLQRYDVTTFQGGALKTDASALGTFKAGDKLEVRWSGDTASLYVNDVLQSSFDCSTQIASEGWAKYAGWLETNAGSSTIALADFTLIG